MRVSPFKAIPHPFAKNVSQVVAAAEAWCLLFGSNRPEDIAFVVAEIRKAWAAAELRRIGTPGEKKTRTASKSEELPAVTSSMGSLGVGGDRTEKAEGKGERVVVETRRREGGGKRMTVESPLAADVEAGTSLFWVQVWCCFGGRFAAVRWGAVCSCATGFVEVLCCAWQC